MSIKLKKGFTLIELLVVIAIIGLLASVVLVSMGGVRAKARDSIRKQDLRAISTALELYWNKFERYPSEGYWCDSSVGTVNGVGCPPSPLQNDWGANSDLRDLITEGFIGSIPKDPINSSAYYYSYEPDDVGQGSPACTVNTCRWTLCAKLEETGASYCVKSAEQ